MKLLIENYSYVKHTEDTDVYKALKGSGLVNDLELDAIEPVSIEYVGYVYNRECDDVVFCLPKVVLTGVKSKESDNVQLETVFGLSPEELVNFDSTNLNEKKEIKNFLSELAIWIYRSISIFRKNNPNSLILKSADYSNNSNSKQSSHLYTLFDVVLALCDFNKENQNYLMFATKTNHSGNNKILWNKTINKTTAFIEDGAPMYINPVNKKKEVDFEEELLVIYYSILNHIKKHYGFNVNINANYPLITGERFVAYCENGKGRRRLKAIKYKYYSDKALKLWNLCYAYFDQRHDISIKKHKRDYLLVRSFQIVFENMIDELLGDNYFEKGFKEQRDRKRVDHMFIYDSLVRADIDQQKYNTYYISDSKYYSRRELKDLKVQKTEEDSSPMTGIYLQDKDVYKQFTYARNVVQCNLDLFFREPANNVHPLMRPDDLTEGYNIIPNFFISAYIPTDEDENTDGKNEKSFDFRSDRLQPTGAMEFNRHFDNRLFDRDTLLLNYYNINFLFVVSLYGRNNKSKQINWRNKVRKIFKTKVQNELDRLYNFYVLRPKYTNWQDYIKLHFHELNGKIFRPKESKQYLIMALLKDNEESRALLEKYNVDFKKVEKDRELVDKALSDMFDKQELSHLQDINTVDFSDQPLIKPETSISKVKCLIFNLLGEQYVRCDDKLANDPRFGVAIQDSGNVLELDEGLTSAGYLIITNKKECKVYFLDSVKKPIFLTKEHTVNMLTTKADTLVHLVFHVDITHNIEAKEIAQKVDMDKVRKLFGVGHGIKLIDIEKIL